MTETPYYQLNPLIHDNPLWKTTISCAFGGGGVEYCIYMIWKSDLYRDTSKLALVLGTAWSSDMFKDAQ